MDSYFLSEIFFRYKFNPNAYMLRTIDSILILVLYVDDILIIDSLVSAIVAVKGIINYRFLMTYMSPLYLFLGLEINQDASSINISQAKYDRDLMERFHMIDCKYAPTPFLYGVRLKDRQDTPVVENTLYRQIMGSILYLTHTQLDVSYAVGVVSRYMQESHELQ
jgi:hypothetical protein